MKVIFLDIDGVLNSDRTSEKCNSFDGIQSDLADRLKAFLAKNPDVKLVLSSTWRNWPGMTECLKVATGFEFIGETDYLRGMPRGIEIERYLTIHKEITCYAILDDLPRDEFKNLRPTAHVLVDPAIGLQDHDIIELDHILNPEKTNGTDA